MDYGSGISFEFGNDLGGIVIGVFLFLVGYRFYFKKKKYSIYKLGLLFLLFIYGAMVIGVTLTPIPLNMAEVKHMQLRYNESDWFNLILFKDVFVGKEQFLLNTILFIPFGILYPLYKNKIRFKYVLLSSLIFTLVIEVTQLVFSVLFQIPAWFFDINDIIANVFGGIIGYLIVKIIVKPILRCFDNRK